MMLGDSGFFREPRSDPHPPGMRINKVNVSISILVILSFLYIGELDSEMKKLPKLKVVVTHLEKYWDKIFARGIQVNIQGETKTVFPHRTNNTSEQFYRRLKQILRRLHGNSKVNKDLIYFTRRDCADRESVESNIYQQLAEG